MFDSKIDTFNFSKFYFYFKLCLCMCVCGFVYVYVAVHGGRRHPISVKLDLKAVLNHSTLVLRTELESCQSMSLTAESFL